MAHHFVLDVRELSVSSEKYFSMHDSIVWLYSIQYVFADCYQRKEQKPAAVVVWECTSAHGMNKLHMCDGNIDAYIWILDSHML